MSYKSGENELAAGVGLMAGGMFACLMMAAIFGFAAGGWYWFAAAGFLLLAVLFGVSFFSAGEEEADYHLRRRGRY